MSELLEMEKIRQLKYRYFRCLDTNDWPEFEKCFTEDCKAAYSDGKLTFENRAEIVKFMSDNMSGDQFLSMHHGHHPEITLTGDSTATGIWYLEDLILDLKNRFKIFGAAIYSDEYRKVDGEWKISSIGYKRTFECGEPISEHLSVMSNMFSKAED